MPGLVWDQVGDRTYESGLDRGVLYLPDGSAVPWNGLTSIVENFDREANPVYYDGMKISELITLGSFSATLSAVTYPDEFTELEGTASLKGGFILQDQPPQSFALCYRTKVGNDFAGPDAHYKIHILYNLFAIPSDKTYASVGDDPSLVEFEWEITQSEEVPGFRPMAHIIIDSSKIDPWLLEDLELQLYGGSIVEASLLPMPSLVEFIKEWYRVKIVDHGDGSWSAIEGRPGFITFIDVNEEIFQIIKVNATFLSEDEFEISDTTDDADVPNLIIYDNGDGTWTAATASDNIIVMLDEDTFEIRNATVLFQSDDIFRITDEV
jgi:hypothetical protein